MPGPNSVTARQITLVQDSFQKVVPISATAADLFYDRLFELDPAVRSLFSDDLSEQKQKLMQTLAFAVNGLNDLGTVVPAVQALGQRHTTYGVSDSHYDTVGAALLWTLGQGLGDGFTAEVEDAWKAVYGLLADTMRTASASI